MTKVTYRTHPAIHQIVKFQLSVTYTQASYREFLKTRLGLQRNLAAANFTAYFWPSPTGFNANLWGHNSADISGKNATLLPLYQWAQQETAAGRPATVQNTAEVLDSYFDIFDLPPDQQSLGAGTLLVGGSRLLPFSSMEGAPLDTLIDVLMETPVIAVFMGAFFSLIILNSFHQTRFKIYRCLTVLIDV